VTSHKPERGDPRNALFELAPGLWCQPTPYNAHAEIEGAVIDAELDWVDGRAVIDSLTVRRGGGEITTAVLRSISLPGLLAAASTAARFWTSEDGGEEVTEERDADESLEEHAARLARMALATGRSPAAVIAQAQGIEESTAAQRLVTIRKMGLLEPSDRKAVAR
jgi:hypothetical protein